MEGQMSETNRKRENGLGAQPMPSWATYTEAMNKFSRSAKAFMEHVHLLTEARTAYQEAMSIGTELRNRLDAGDSTLRGLMTQLELVVSAHIGEAADGKRPELVKGENTSASEEATGTWRAFP
jgi:hypothetical protein